jgi:glycosyltransferase involved in cell wall biosynthesis
MRPLWIVERFPPQKGGVATAAGRQVALLASAAEGLDVLQLSADVPPGHVAAEAGDGFTVHRLGRAPRDEESHRLLFQVAVELGRARGHSHVHGFYAVHSGYLATLVGRVLGRPSLVSLRGNDVDLGAFQGNRQPLLRQTLETADLVLPVSHELREMVALLCGRQSGVRVVHNGVDTTAFAPGAAPAAALAEVGEAPRPWIGFSGELRFKKGLTLLQGLAERMAEAEVAATSGRDWRAGGCGAPLPRGGCGSCPTGATARGSRASTGPWT